MGGVQRKERKEKKKIEMLFDASEIKKLFIAKHAMLTIKMIQGFLGWIVLEKWNEGSNGGDVAWIELCVKSLKEGQNCEYGPSLSICTTRRGFRRVVLDPKSKLGLKSKLLKFFKGWNFASRFGCQKWLGCSQTCYVARDMQMDKMWPLSITSGHEIP